MSDPTLWPLVPVGVAIAVLYTSTGISGANFWVPVYVLWLELDTAVAFWLALVTMLFGSLSGLARHAGQATVDYRQSGRYLATAAPAAAIGALMAPRLPAPVVLAGFGLFALGYSLHLALTPTTAAGRAAGGVSDSLAAAVGGLGVGVVSVGLGALLLPRCLGEARSSPRGRGHAKAVGTVVLAVFVASLVAALARLGPELLAELRRNGPRILTLLAFVVPAVLVGGQLGPLLARRLDRGTMRRYAAVLLAVVGALMLLRARPA